MTSNDDAFSASLAAAAKYAQIWLDEIPNRGINPKIDVDQVRAAFGDALPKQGVDATQVIERLGTLGEPGLMGMGSGRFFGWVIGGTKKLNVPYDCGVSIVNNAVALRRAFGERISHLFSQFRSYLRNR